MSLANVQTLAPPSLYKYLRTDHARRMMSQGEIYIGTLSYYRDIEDQVRADRNEGRKDSVTVFPERTAVTEKDGWERKLGFLAGSNIHYESGTVEIEAGTRFVGNDDVPDAYIYCTSTTYSQNLRARFGESCIEIFDPPRFLDVASGVLAKSGLIYAGLSSGRLVEYTGHTVDAKTVISGNWLKDEQFREEAEFRFCFVPIIEKGGDVIQPVISHANGITRYQFPDARDIELKLKPQIIACKGLTKYCRWR